VLNAGIINSGRALLQQDMAEVDRQIAVNRRGAIAVTRIGCRRRNASRPLA
jgi:NAD(P)-dependent dehydrogenase (short-subunit alcohol dehydrogenase family)